MTKLSVNINKIATLRNARGGNIPDVIKATIDIQRFGADGITVHPRPDERHIRYADVRKLRGAVKKEFNIEGFPDEKFLQLVEEVVPEQCTLVPDNPTVLTSSQGWDTISNKKFLAGVIERLHKKNIRVSLFVNPENKMITGAVDSGADSIELYTGPYAEMFFTDKTKAIKPYIEAAEHAHQNGLGINAGHDLNLENLNFFSRQILKLDEVSIGHALISDALYFGLQNVVPMYKRLLQQ